MKDFSKQESEQAASICILLREVLLILDCIVLQLLKIRENLHRCSRSGSVHEVHKIHVRLTNSLITVSISFPKRDIES
jgi:hypothetical protein